MKGKKILIVCQHFWPEPFRITDIADYFAEQGYTVDVLCGIPNFPDGKIYKGYSYIKNRKQRRDKIKVRRCFELPRGNGSTTRILLNNITFSLSAIAHLPRLLTKKYDQVFMYQLSPITMTTVGILYAKIRRVPSTMWVIDLWPDNVYSYLNLKNRPIKRLLKSLSSWHYRRTDKLVSISESMGDTLKELSGGKPVLHLPMACEKVYEQEIYDATLQHKYKDKFTIVHAGNMSPILSLETMIDAAKELQDEGYQINWVLLGGGSYTKELKALVKQQKLNNFFFEGAKKVDEIPKYTTVADALFSSLKSDKELDVTIPSKILSYLAAGKPIVVSANGVTADYINTIGCGVTSPAEDSKMLANNIKKLLNMSKEERASIGRKGKDYHMIHNERGVVLNRLHRYMTEAI